MRPARTATNIGLQRYTGNALKRMPERRAKNETNRRSADPHADTDACGLWSVEVTAHDPMGVEETEGAEI